MGQFILNRFLKNFNIHKRFFVTLIALPLIPDHLTRHIARYVDRIINLPADPTQGWRLLQRLTLDILIFPDWQPFPDTQSLYYQASRIAPIQICLFVRGSSCGSGAIDYYLLPTDLQESFLQSPQHPPGQGTGNDFPPPYLERFTEQVILLDWPIFTPASIIGIVSSFEEESTSSDPTSSVSPDSHHHASPHDLHFIPSELEGKVFFDGQPVALLPIDPSYFHPLMDDALITLLNSIHDLQILLVIPEIFATVLPSSTPQSPSLSEYQLQSRYLSLEWAKKLVRRLSSKVLASGGSSGGRGNAHQRIRLFPQPLSDSRLLQLMKQVDVILDTFPIGNSLYPLALGLSVGTPIITLKSGVQTFHANRGGGKGTEGTGSYEEKEIRSFLYHQSSRDKYSENILYQHILQSNSSLPWLPSVSSLASLYEKIGLQQDLVARYVGEYVDLAHDMIVNKEKAYQIRIKILEHLDSYLLTQPASSSGSSGGNRPFNPNDESIKDLERFLHPSSFSPHLLQIFGECWDRLGKSESNEEIAMCFLVT